MSNLAHVAADITLIAALRRIQRKAAIMELDAPRSSAALQDAQELQLLAGIALRCIGVAENA